MISFTCNFGDFEKLIVVFFTRWNWRALENIWYFSFAVDECVVGYFFDRVQSVSLSDLYTCHPFFVDRHWKNADLMESHNFLKLKYSVSFKVKAGQMFCKLQLMWIFSGDFRSGHFMIPADGSSEYEESFLTLVQSMRKIWFMWWLIFNVKGVDFSCGNIWSHKFSF